MCEDAVVHSFVNLAPEQLIDQPSLSCAGAIPHALEDLVRLLARQAAAEHFGTSPSITVNPK